MRTRIAALSPKDAVAVPSLAATAACLATWAGGLLFGGDGVTGLRFRCARGCLPRPRDHLGRHDSFGFDQGLLLSRRAPRVVRSSHEAAVLPCSMPMPPVLTGRPMAHPSIRPRRLKCGNVANPCLPVHLPGPVQNALPFRKRHLDVDSRKLRLPRPCRIPAGCPVARSVEVASDHTAIGRLQSGVSVPLAPRRHQKRMFSSLAAAALHADLAPRHYRKPAPARAVAVVVTGRRPRTTASSSSTTRSRCPTRPPWAPPAARSRKPGGHRHEHHVDATGRLTSAPGRPPWRSVANLTVIPRTNPISCA